MTSIATDSWEEQATEIRFSRKVREIRLCHARPPPCDVRRNGSGELRDSTPHTARRASATGSKPPAALRRPRLYSKNERTERDRITRRSRVQPA